MAVANLPSSLAKSPFSPNFSSSKSCHSELSISVETHSTATALAGSMMDTQSISKSRISAYRIKGQILGCCIDDPRTRKGRRMQLVKILGMAAIPIVVLVIQASLSIYGAILQMNYARSFRDQVRFCTEAGAVVHAMALERGTTTFYVSIPDEELLRTVYQKRAMVDEALQNLTTWPIDDTDRNDDLMQSKENMKSRLVINRLTMSETATTPMRQLQFYTRINLHLLKWIGKAILHSQSHEQRWQHLTAYHTFITAKEHFGSERGSATVYFARGKMELDIYLFHLRKRFEGIAFLNKSRQYNSYIDQQLDLHYNGTQLEANITVQRSLLEGNNQSHKDVQAGWIYFQQMTSYLDILHDIEKALEDNLIEDLNKSLYFTGMTFWADLFVLILAVVLLPAIIIFLRTITGQIQNFAKILQAKNEEIVKEKRRADAVLCQLLPRQIAEKMKNREVVHPESYDQVTVFFSDIVDFTSFSAVSTPMQVVETLNKLYTAIDSRVENYDVYKVETIGDAYLCVSGLPERNGNRHSYEIASMSLELLTDVVRIVIPHKQDYTMRLRIGMHTGPCAAGIVGQRMPRYCIFGDTVNTASRMESTGEPLKIHISTAVRDALLAFGGVFEMECRGEITVKGKGLMTTYWLLHKTKLRPPPPLVGTSRKLPLATRQLWRKAAAAFLPPRHTLTADFKPPDSLSPSTDTLPRQ